LPVPAGSTANAVEVPTSPAITARTVPSPPQTKTTSAPSSTARRACPVPGSSAVVSHHVGAGQPAAAIADSISRRRSDRSSTLTGLATTAERNGETAEWPDWRLASVPRHPETAAADPTASTVRLRRWPTAG